VLLIYWQSQFLKNSIPHVLAAFNCIQKVSLSNGESGRQKQRGKQQFPSIG
jgi:hypothetical protein